MKGGRYISYIFILVFAGLLCLLGWNSVNMYRYEKEQIKGEIEAAIGSAAYKIQWHNGSLTSSYALMLTDKDYGSKVAFAAGFTRNKGKISMYFDDGDTIPIAPGSDPVDISKEFIRKNNITYKPASVMTIDQFDSLFKIELAGIHARIPYKINRSKRTDTVGTKDVVVSAPFIIDFFAPKIYSIHYKVPLLLVVKNMAPYLASNLLVSLLLVAGFIFYRRSYRMQVQQAEFRESLFGNITHELKTPLTSLQLIVDDAKKNISDGPSVTIPARHIAFAENELKRMKLIVDKILSFSKMSHEQFTFNKERVDLNQMISESITVMELKIQQTNGSVIYEPVGQVTVLGDPVLLVNAVSELIDNGLKYTERSPEIHINLTATGQQVCITVKDNGLGIPPEIGKKIFDPFFRIPTGNVHNVQGHGLGLSFVQQVMKLHEGTVTFDGSETGTAFYLKFKVS